MVQVLSRVVVGLALLLGASSSRNVKGCVGAACPDDVSVKASTMSVSSDPEVASLEQEVLRLRDELAKLRIECTERRRYYIKVDRSDKGLEEMEAEISKLEWTLGGLREKTLRSYDDKVKADVEGCREAIERLEKQQREDKFNDVGVVETKMMKATTPKPETGEIRYNIPEKKPVPKLPLGVRKLVDAPKPKPPPLTIGKNPPVRNWYVNAPTEPPMGKLKVRLSPPCVKAHKNVVHEGVMNPKVGDYTMEEKVYKSEVTMKTPCNKPVTPCAVKTSGKKALEIKIAR